MDGVIGILEPVAGQQARRRFKTAVKNLIGRFAETCNIKPAANLKAGGCTSRSAPARCPDAAGASSLPRAGYEFMEC